MRKSVKLKDIVEYAKGSQINGDNLIEEAEFDYLNGGINPSGKWNETNCDANTITISEGGNSCGYVNYMRKPFWCGAHCYYIYNVVGNTQYLYYALKSQQDRIMKLRSGACMPNIKKGDLGDFEFNFDDDVKGQEKVTNILSKLESVIEERKQELLCLDKLTKARFVEMFGNLKTNSKGWQIAGFNECAIIDTNMIHDFQGYEDYPHIGIDSIEKETGKLVGYRTIAEDRVISGKYLFTPQHIIYSKIRPNLNKVALPDFDGLCSADAYPILVKKEICNREYMGYTLRNKYFLDYILAFSSRTNLPKVNKNQVEGFKLPLPPIQLQNQFADFVHQVDKSKVAVQKALDETKLLFDSLMQKYFG